MKTSRLYQLTLFLLFAISCTNNRPADEQAGAISIVNPVLPGDHPDPTVIKIGDTYWASATPNGWGPLFPIHKSTDLVNWEQVSYVFADLPWVGPK